MNVLTDALMRTRTLIAVARPRFTKSVLPLAACVALTGCVSTPPEEDPVVQRLTELDGRLLRIERVLANQSLLDLSQRIEAVNAEVRTLRGQFDELQHGLTRAQDQQREMYEDCLCQFVMSNFFDEIYSLDFSNVSMVRQIFLWELVLPSKKKQMLVIYLTRGGTEKQAHTQTHTHAYVR